MRDIKFRAWQIEEKKMLDDISTWTDDFTDMLNETFKMWKDEAVDEGTGVILMQYIGRKDIDGKDLYEDDIVQREYGGEDKRLIRFVGSGFWLVDYWKGEQDIEPTHGELQKWKIIGNIHENKELL